MNPGRNPVLLVILNYVVGVAVAKGLLNQESAPEIVNLIADIFGLIIILATSIYSLYKAFHNKALLKTQSTIIEQKTTPPSEDHRGEGL